MKGRMKKILLLGLFLFFGVVSYGQVTLTIEINADGVNIADADGLQASDIKWSASLNTGCSVNDVDCKPIYVIFGPMGGDLQALLVDMGIFEDCKNPAKEGDQVTFTMQVTNPAHKYFGYKAKTTYTVPGSSFEFMGGDGINLSKGAELSISVPDLALCTGVAGSVTATVTADVPYKVTWSGGINASGTDGVTGTIPASLAAGKYTATVTTADGTASKDFQLTRNLTPAKPTLTQDPGSICLNESVTLTATTTTPGAVTYVWQDGTPGNTFTVTPTAKNTRYSVTPALGTCVGPTSDERALSFNPDLAMDATKTKIDCKIGFYDASVTMKNGTNWSVYTDAACTDPVLNAFWTPITKTVKFTDQDLGSHDYFIKADGVCNVVSVTINDEGACACGATLSMADGDITFCEGTPTDIKISLNFATGTSDMFKKWSFVLKDPDGDEALKVTDETFAVSWNYTPTKSGIYTLEGFSASDNLGNHCGTIEGATTKIVTINPRPTVSFIKTKDEGCFGEDLTLTATTLNGTQPYTYIWTGEGIPAGSNDVVNMTIQAGDKPYKVQVKDGNNCLSVETVVQKVLGHKVEVTATAAPSTIQNGQTSLLGSTVKLTPTDASPSLKYSWTPANMLAAGGAALYNPVTVNLTTNQEYKVVVTDNKTTCKGTDRVMVNVRGSALAVTATGGSECEGTTIRLGCTPSGGAGDGVITNYTYTWTPSSGLTLTDTRIPAPEVSVTTPPGSYTATVTVNDGTNSVTSAPVTIVVKKMPKLSNIAATPSSGTNSVTSSLTVTVDPPTGVDLLWAGPAGSINSGERTDNAMTNPLTEDTKFTITASMAGCVAEGEVSVTVTKRELVLTKVDGSKGCKNGTVYTAEAFPENGVPFPGGGYNYSWGASSPAGINLINATTKKVTVQNSSSLAAGIYTIPVTVTDAAGQTATKNAQIEVYGNIQVTAATKCDPADPTTFQGIIMVAAGEKPYTVYADAGATTPVTDITWNAAGDQGTFTTLFQSGTRHTYYVKDQYGCNTPSVELTADCSCGAELVMTQGDKTCASSNTDINIIINATGGTEYSFDLVNELGVKVLTVKNDNANSQWTHPVRYAERGKFRIDNFKAVTASSAPGVCTGNVFPGEIDVQFFPTPRVDAGADISACGTGTVTLKANGDAGLTYGWDKGVQDGVAFTPPMGLATTYTLTGTDAHGCFNTDQVEISVHSTPNVAAMATPNVVCQGGVVTLNHNGNADTYTWNNGGQSGPNNVPQTTTRYTVTGTITATGCSDTSSVLVTVMLPAEITERPKDRTIAIGKDVTYKVKAIGNDLTYAWEWYDPVTNMWTSFVDNTVTSPKVSGAGTEELSLKEVPAGWDGRKVKCIVTGGCGPSVEAVANLRVKECFEIVADLKMGDGIRPETAPGSAVDGWYCKGNRISLKAIVGLADPENGTVANPHFTWSIDGLPADKVIESDSSVLSWIPEPWEDDIVVKVCVYSDGACDQVCSRYLRLKARTPDDVKMQMVTSIDPERKFCPGDAIDFTVAVRNDGRASDFHWYRDIFDKGTGRSKTFVMNQKDTWIKVVLVPSEEMCVEGVVADSMFLQVKDSVTPTLYIRNNIGDTIACRGDKLTFEAVYTDAGANPSIQWRKDVWDIGTGKFVEAELEDNDMWIKCFLVPGNDVCYDQPALVDSMVIRVMEDAKVTIVADMEGKVPGDELIFISTVENMVGNRKYEWFVNSNLSDQAGEDYISSVLKKGDVVVCAVSGESICHTRVFSNQITVLYGRASRDTLVEIYKGESIKNLSMFKPGDKDYIFKIIEKPTDGHALMLPNGDFRYTPDWNFVGTDVVKYRVFNIFNKDKFEEGYIWINVKDNERFFVPNIITPNGDGLNDTWILDFLADYPDHLISVFNGFSSQLVFQANHYQSDWDGTGKSNGGYVAHFNLPNGIYTYIIDLKDKSKTILKGWLEIRADLNRRGIR